MGNTWPIYRLGDDFDVVWGQLSGLLVGWRRTRSSSRRQVPRVVTKTGAGAHDEQPQFLGSQPCQQRKVMPSVQQGDAGGRRGVRRRAGSGAPSGRPIQPHLLDNE
jgi:hypothetical protein